MIDYMKCQQLAFNLSTGGKTRCDFKVQFNKAVDVHRIEYHLISPSAGGDRIVGISLSKMPYDTSITPTSQVQVVNNDHSFARLLTHQISDSAVGFDDFLCSYYFDFPKPLRFVIDPTWLHYVAARQHIAIVYYDLVTVSKAEFDRIAMWQGGFDYRG